MAGAANLLSAVLASGAFLADTAPVIYRLERAAPSRFTRAIDPLFDAVERGDLGCIISAVVVAELFIKPRRTGPVAVAAVDAFLGQPAVGIVDLGERIAREAAGLVADRSVPRLPDALIAATALDLGLPIITGDRHLARSGAVEALLVADFAD